MDTDEHELREAHRAYYEAWNRAFRTRDPAPAVTYVSTQYTGTFVGADGKVELQNAASYVAGIEEAMRSLAEDARWIVEIKHAEMRSATEGLLLYRGALQMPGHSGVELFLEVWRKEAGGWKLFRGCEEVV